MESWELQALSKDEKGVSQKICMLCMRLDIILLHQRTFSSF